MHAQASTCELACGRVWKRLASLRGYHTRLGRRSLQLGQWWHACIGAPSFQLRAALCRRRFGNIRASPPKPGSPHDHASRATTKCQVVSVQSAHSIPQI
jgi:hypothetical protein